MPYVQASTTEGIPVSLTRIVQLSKKSRYFGATCTERLHLPLPTAHFRPKCVDPHLRNDKRIGIDMIFKQGGRVNLVYGARPL
jgi:hypothetical protein